MIDNFQQAAAAEIQIGLAHLRAAIIYWSPGKGLSPRQEKDDDASQNWRRFQQMIEDLDEFARDVGP